MFRVHNPGVSYGFRIREENLDLIEEAEMGRDSWLTTKVYERFQSRPEKSEDTTEKPQTIKTVAEDSAKPTVERNEKHAKKTRKMSNKEILERSSFHQDIFSANRSEKKTQQTLDIYGVQNEASVSEQLLVEEFNARKTQQDTAMQLQGRKTETAKGDQLTQFLTI